MQYQYPHLCAPITIAGVTFRNRMFSAPMGGTDITNDGCIGPKSTAFYELRAKGGAGAVTVSECMVHPATDGSHAYHLDESILNSLAAATYTADAIRRHGAMPSLELSHSGMYAGTYMTDKTKQHAMHQWGPSDTTRPDGVAVKALSKEQIADIVKAYGHVAGLAKRAGFEMLMIHGGHGWLINQFFSPYFNHRTDEYGGCLENRCRFAIEVLKSVREAVGPRFPIEFRLSGSELFEGGYDLEEGCRIAQQIEPYIDLLHVSAGTYQRGFGDTHPSMFKDHGCNVYLAAEIKKHVSVPVATIGGLYAAYTAARRGHQVILCEKDSELGGILKSEQALPFKQEMYQLAGTYAKMARKADVEIRLNTAVTPELVEAEAPDALIIAVGSAPLVPPIPGLDGDNVVIVNNYYKEKDKVTDDVVVFGGGLAGCECAIHLGQEGKRVHLVEMRDALAPDANVRHRPLLLKEIEKYVTVHTGCKGLEVRPDGILCETKDGEQVLVPGTSVICALGQRSRTADVEALRGTAPFVRIIGDAAKVSTITNAVYWGYHAALDIGTGC